MMPTLPGHTPLLPTHFTPVRGAEGYSVHINVPGFKTVVCLDRIPGHAHSKRVRHALASLCSDLTLEQFATSERVRRELWTLQAEYRPADTLQTLRTQLLAAHRSTSEERCALREEVRARLRHDEHGLGWLSRVRSEQQRLDPQRSTRNTFAGHIDHIQRQLTALGIPYPDASEQFSPEETSTLTARLEEYLQERTLTEIHA